MASAALGCAEADGSAFRSADCAAAFGSVDQPRVLCAFCEGDQPRVLRGFCAGSARILRGFCADGARADLRIRYVADESGWVRSLALGALIDSFGSAKLPPVAKKCARPQKLAEAHSRMHASARTHSCARTRACTLTHEENWAHPCHICTRTTGGSPLARVAGAPPGVQGGPRGAGEAEALSHGTAALHHALRRCVTALQSEIEETSR